MEKVSFLRKFGVCLVAGLVTAAALRRIGALYLTAWIPLAAVWLIVLLLLFSCIVYAFIWQYRERKNNIPQERIMKFFQAMLLYALAYDLFSFGWQKIFHMQMIVPLGELDRPFSSFSGEQLTWAYFRWSYPYTVAIGASQIICAVLSLFSRTRLLALIMMIPILANIIMIDTFYQMPIGVLVHACVLLAGVLYLLLLACRPLWDFFFKANHLSQVGAGTPGWRSFFRIAILVIPLIFLATYNFPDKNPQLTGKYEVRHLRVNDQPQSATSVRDSVLTRVYMDLQNDLVLEFNHYDSRYIGTYQLDRSTGAISASWRYPRAFKETFSGKLLPGTTAGTLHFTGMLGKDSLDMDLVKVPTH